MNRNAIALAAMLGGLVACAQVGGLHAPGEGPPLESEVARPTADTTIRGRVELDAMGYKTQATTADAAKGAAAALLDWNSQEALATSLTTPDGAFTLEFPDKFVPVAGRGYHLEAMNGLGGNKPGNPLVRLRTLLVWTDKGWTSLTDGTPGGEVLVGRSTTAVSAMIGLLAGVEEIPPSSVMGKLTILASPGRAPAPDRLAATAGILNQNFDASWAIIDQALKADKDPIQAIGYDARIGRFFLNNPRGLAITGVSPASAQGGDTIEFSGANFDAIPQNNWVTFEGGSAEVGLPGSLPSKLRVKVPSTALSGVVTIQVADLIFIGPSIKVRPSVGAFSPLTGKGGDLVIVNGSGFDPIPGLNTVKVGNSLAAVTVVDGPRLQIKIPYFGASGKITISTAGGSAVSGDSASFASSVRPKLKLPGR